MVIIPQTDFLLQRCGLCATTTSLFLCIWMIYVFSFSAIIQLTAALQMPAAHKIKEKENKGSCHKENREKEHLLVNERREKCWGRGMFWKSEGGL